MLAVGVLAAGAAERGRVDDGQLGPGAVHQSFDSKDLKLAEPRCSRPHVDLDEAGGHGLLLRRSRGGVEGDQQAEQRLLALPSPVMVKSGVARAECEERPES